jgi:hypothetical protein
MCAAMIYHNAWLRDPVTASDVTWQPSVLACAVTSVPVTSVQLRL